MWRPLLHTGQVFNFTVLFCGDGFPTTHTKKETDPFRHHHHHGGGLGAEQEGMLVSGISLISLWSLLEKRFRQKWARSIERIARDAT
jgi:hypothetical protein